MTERGDVRGEGENDNNKQTSAEETFVRFVPISIISSAQPLYSKLNMKFRNKFQPLPVSSPLSPSGNIRLR